MTLVLAEDMMDMGGERQKLKQMLAEEPLTLFHCALGENAPSRGASPAVTRLTSSARLCAVVRAF